MGLFNKSIFNEIKIAPIIEEDEEQDQTSDAIEKKIIEIVESGDSVEFQRIYMDNPKFVKAKGSDGKQILHHAAARDKVSMVKLILRCGADIDAQDLDGNTPLHCATATEALETLEYLINKGADTSKRDRKYHAITHLAVEKRKLGALRLLVRYTDKVNLLLGAEHGRTPLHLAAINHDVESAEIILSIRVGRFLTHLDENGIAPVHAAARSGSVRVLQVLLNYGVMMGFTRLEMMSIEDSHGNTPLHAAVFSGEILVVKFCLENGGKISHQQHELTSPVHLACYQGSLELVKLMFQMQPDEKLKTLDLPDAQGMTPLHYAAMFDHVETVRFLIAEGANINAQDSEQRSPLLIAASRSCWNTVHALLQLGADLSVKDTKNRNILHLIITHGGKVEDFIQDIQMINQEKLDVLSNDRDSNGCTPLHYASKIGQFRSTESLISMGALVTLKNNAKESPLHFAARYGRYQTVVQLLHGDKGLSIINEVDGEGLTALSLASLNGHTRIVQLLINTGALLQRDHRGRTPLHLAASNGCISTMQVLLAVHSQLLDQKDKNGNTPLHLAASNNKANAVDLLLTSNCKFVTNARGFTPMDIALQKRHHEAAKSMATHEPRAHEILSMTTEKSETVISIIIATMPDVFLAVLDKCVEESGDKDDIHQYHIKYSFEYLQYTPVVSKKLRQEIKDFQTMPLPALNTMVRYHRLELLCHEVCQKYIEMKWNAYGMYFHLINVSLYIIFMALLTVVASFLIMEINQEMAKLSKHNNYTDPQEKKVLYVTLDICRTVTLNGPIYLAAMAVMVASVINAFKELVQFYQQGMKYLLDPLNYLEWALYISSFFMVVPIFDCSFVLHQLENSSVAVFVAWFNFLLYLQRFDKVGIYVVMFIEILKTLVKALMIFSILLIAFGLAFHILLFRLNLGFLNFPISFIRVFTMMLGEFDFMDTFTGPTFDESSTIHDLPIFTLFFLIIFMVLMPILLVNLLIGLAVGDIEGVRRNAHLKRIAMQVEMHTELERKLPQFILERVDEEEVIEYPNTITSTKFRWIFPLLQRIMDHLQSTDTTTKHETHTNAAVQNDNLTEALQRQKNRLNEIASTLEDLRNLLKLVVEKMEIRIETEDIDESGQRSRKQTAVRIESAKPVFVGM